MSEQSIPGPDSDFDEFFGNIQEWAADNAATYGASTQQVSAVTNTHDAWTTSYNAHKAAQAAATPAAIDKDAKRKQGEAALRSLIGTIQKNALMTDTVRGELQITVPDTTRTPAAVPATAPTITKIERSAPCSMRLFFADSETPESRAKPDGVGHIELREQIGGTEPTNCETMQMLGTTGRSPFRANFEMADMGKTVYLAARWVNTRNQPGPWSLIFKGIIPS